VYKTAGWVSTSIKGLCLSLGLAVGLFAADPAITTTISGTLGSVLGGSGAVVSATYESGGTVQGSAGQFCELAFSNGGGSGASGRVRLTGMNSIASGAKLDELVYGSGYTTAPTQATFVQYTGSGTAATCTGTATVQTKINDPLSLSGTSFSASITGIDPVGVSYNANSITYNNLTASVTVLGFPLQCSSASSTVSVNNVLDGGYDTLTLGNCNTTILGLSGSFTSTIAVPAGTFPAPIPIPFGPTSLVTSPASASEGTYTVTANGSTASTTLGVQGTVGVGCSGCPSESLSTNSLTFGAQQGGSAPASQLVTVNTSPSFAMPYAVTVTTTSGGSWLTVNGSTTTTGGTTGGSFSVDAIPGALAAGTYTGTITVYTASSAVQTVNVTFTVTPPTPTLQSGASSLSFTAVNAAAPASQNLNISSSSSTAISYTVSYSPSGSWLQVSPSSGTQMTPTTESVSINSSALATLTAGTYSGSVTFTCTTSCTNQNSQLTVPVTLTVTAALVPSPTSLSFDYTINGTVPSGLPLGVTSNPASTAVNYNAGASTTNGGNWLTVSPGSATTPTGVTAALNTAVLTGLAAGTYNGNIALSSTYASNGTQNVPVTLVVHPQPTISVSPSTLAFGANVNGADPPSQNVTLTVGNGPISYTVAASPTGGWLSVTPTSGNSSTTLVVSAHTGSLAASTTPYTGTITVTATGASGSPAVVNVNFTVGSNPISTSPASLTFNYQVTGTTPVAQNLTVNTVTAGTPFTATASTNSGGAWLNVNGATSANGTTSQTLSISVANLPTTAGTYTGSITIDDSGQSSNSPYPVPVTLVVSPPPPLTANPTALSFHYQPGGSAPPNQSVALAIGTASVHYTAAVTAGNNYFSVSPGSANTPSSITVSVMNYASLAPGNYTGTITVTPDVSNTLTIPLTLTVSSLAVSPPSLSFSYSSGDVAPPAQSIAVSTTAGNAVAFSAGASTTSGGSWLHLSAASGVTPASLMVSIVPGPLAVGTYTGTVVISAPGYTSQSVAVTLTVLKPKAVIQLSGNTSFVLANTAQPVTSALTVSASDGSAQAFTIAVSGANSSWLSLSAKSGTTPATITATANPSGLTPGLHVAQITVTTPQLTVTTKTFSAQLNITGSNLAASPSSLSFTFQPGSPPPSAQSVALTVANGQGSIALSSVTTDVQWLKVVPITSAPGTLQISVSPSLLTPGTYGGDVVVKGMGSPNTSLQIPVTLTVSALPQFTATPASLSFTYQIGGAASAPQSIALAAGSVPLSFIVTPPGDWLQVSPVRGTTPASLLVTANPTGLAAGTYGGTLSVTATGANASISIPITLTVAGSGPQNTGPLTITPSQLFFSAPAGGSAPAPQTIMVLNSSGGSSFTAASGAAWLTVTPASGTTPASLAVAVNPAGLATGTYTGVVNVTASGSPTPQPVVVTFQVTAASATTPTLQGIINAASGAVGTVSPGMILSIFGQGLGPVTGVSFKAPAEGGTIDTTLGGTQVLFDGNAVPLLYSSNGQVNAIVPFDLTNKASTEMQVMYNGVSSTGMTLPVVAAVPGLFTVDGSGKGQGAILNSDSTVNSKDNPAAAGLPIVLFGTGGGLTDPPSIDGALNPISSTGKLVLPVTVTIGGQPAEVQYYGPAPDLISGVIQINAVIPAGTPSGPAPVIVTVGTATSPPVDVTVK